MNTQEVADRLVKLCRDNKNLEAIDELYAENVVSKEPKGSDMALTTGKSAVRKKTEEWYEKLETMHKEEISEPLVADGYFSIMMYVDATYKTVGRMPMSELAVYGVKDGKIISDEFFYAIPDQ